MNISYFSQLEIPSFSSPSKTYQISFFSAKVNFKRLRLVVAILD
jgi:hypothetical protein